MRRHISKSSIASIKNLNLEGKNMEFLVLYLKYLKSWYSNSSCSRPTAKYPSKKYYIGSYRLEYLQGRCDSLYYNRNLIQMEILGIRSSYDCNAASRVRVFDRWNNIRISRNCNTNMLSHRAIEDEKEACDKNGKVKFICWQDQIILWYCTILLSRFLIWMIRASSRYWFKRIMIYISLSNIIDYEIFW